ncbi:hypothetical protein EIP91_003603, partial [Steccherinum ochraceum]
MASISPSYPRNQGFVSPAQLQQWKRDQEQQQQRMSTTEFGQQNFPSSTSLSSEQQQQPLLPEMRRTMSGQTPAPPPQHTRTTSAFSLFGRKSQTMDSQKNSPPPPSAFHKQAASVSDLPKSHNVLTRRTSNPRVDPTAPPPNNGQPQQQDPLSPPASASTQPPQTPMTPSTPGGSSKPPPQLHPEIRSIVQLTAAHAQKIYFSGPMVRRVERQPDGQKPAKDEGWRNVWGQLGGTTLSLWDMKEIEEASKQGRQVPPSYINVTDAFVQVVGTLTTPGTPEAPPQTFANVFSVNTAGLNLLLFSCPSTQALVSWSAALRLAAWEKSRLEEMYTAHLVRIMLNDGRETRSPLVRGKMEGWVRIRVAGQTDWKKLWMVICAGGVLQHDNGSATSQDTRPTSPSAPRKNRLSQLFSRDHSPPQGGTPSKPAIHVFTSPKQKDKKKPILTFRDVAQAFAVYPERPELISRSTLMKLEGVFGDEEMVGSMKNREAWLLVMPELEANNTRASEMLKWLIGIHDAFELYGRPRIYSWDPRDPQSTMFAYPIGPHRDLLFLDRELAENLDPRDDRTSSVRRQLKQILWNRMRGSVPGPDKAQPPLPSGDQPPMLPPLPDMDEEDEPEQPAASGSQLPNQLPSGAAQFSMQIPPLDFEHTPDEPAAQPEPEPEPSDVARQASDTRSAARPLTPITERSNPSMSGDTNIPSQRASLRQSPPGPITQPSFSPPAPAPPRKSPEPPREEGDSTYGGRITTSPTSLPGETRAFGYRPSEEPHFVVASRPASKQGQYGSPKSPPAVPAAFEPANVQPPSSPPKAPPSPHQKTPSPKPASPRPPSISQVSHTSFSPPPPVHPPRASSPSMSVLTSPYSFRESVQQPPPSPRMSVLTSPHSFRDSVQHPPAAPASPRFSMMTSPHSAAPSRVQTYAAQQAVQHMPSTSTEALSSPAISQTDNAPPPPSPAHSSLASSTLQRPHRGRELRDDPPEESVLRKEAGALYYMRHIDGDAPVPTGLRRPPPPPASDEEEDEEDAESSDSPSIYTPPATNSGNPLNVRRSLSPPPFPPSKASSLVYQRGNSLHESPVLASPNLAQNANNNAFVASPTSSISGGSRSPEVPSRYGSVAKPSGARAAPVNKIAGAQSP